MKASELASKIGAEIQDSTLGEVEISYVSTMADAQAGSVSFIANSSYEKFLLSTKASAVIISRSLTLPVGESVNPAPLLLRVEDPYLAFAKTLELFNLRKSNFATQIHPSAVIGSSARISSSACIGAHCYIGEDVRVGDYSVIHPNAVVYDGTVIGKNVVIGAGTVIGFDGFGYAPMSGGEYRKVPQIGNVIIEDDVEIGALCTIDRATVSHTIIRRGVKLDNLIHIAHNVEIGENTVIAAQTGISGSTTIGKRNQIAGQVGMIGHISTSDDVVIIAQSGVSKAITKPGTYFGAPAKEFRTALRQEGALRLLPELIDLIRELQERLRLLEKK